MAAPSKFRKTVFPNGLTLLTERHPEFRTLAVGIWVKVGTRHERPHEAGVSHFLEHMLFKGTDQRSALDIARSVDQVGGDFNAFTTREYTCFHITLLSRDADLALDILGDVVLNSNFDATEFERERKVILQEIAMVEENPEELVQDIHFELAYGKHGLGRPILGTETSIRRMRRSDMLRFFRKHYRPDELIITVAGDVSHETVRKKIRALTRTRWPGRPSKRITKKETGFQPAPKIKQGLWWVPRRTEQVHVVWGVPGTHYGAHDRFAAFLLNVYIGGGMSSALFQEIREKKGIAYTVYSMLTPFLDSGLFTVYVATGMKQVPVCLKLIEECVQKLKKELLSEEELKILRDNLKGTILLASDSVENRMSSIAKNEIFLSRYVGVDEVCKLIDQVTPQDLRRLARKLFRHEQRSVLALGPRPPRSVAQKLRPHYPKKYMK